MTALRAYTCTSSTAKDLRNEETLNGITKIWLSANTAMTNKFFYNVNNLFYNEKKNFEKKKLWNQSLFYLWDKKTVS